MLKHQFLLAKGGKWPAERLAKAIEPLLGERLEGSAEQLRQVAIYLADEYTQIGDSMLIVSRVTGKAIAQITDADIWQPPNVPRDSGAMAKPLPRLRPDLEGFLIQYVFDEDREAQLLARLTDKAHQTELVRTDGDPRLRAATKGGRETMVSCLREALPTLLLASQGAARVFLMHFDISDTPPTDPKLKPLLKCTAMSRVSTPMADPSTFNLKYDRQTALGASMGNGWVRDIALTLSLAAKDHAKVRATVEWPKGEGACPFEIGMTISDFWLGNPDFTQALIGTGINVLWMAVEGAHPTAIEGHIGTIVIDPVTYECRGRELFSRWEVAAAMEYTLYVDWSKVASFEFLNLPVADPRVEVVY